MDPRSTIAAINKLLSTIRAIDPHIEPHQVQILLEIAQKPLSTMRELAEATDVALSSISRNLDVIGDEHWRGGPGLGLVAKDWDPREPRRMVAWLTPKGKQAVSRLLETLECSA